MFQPLVACFRSQRPGLSPGVIRKGSLCFIVFCLHSTSPSLACVAISSFSFLTLESSQTRYSVLPHISSKTVLLQLMNR